MSDQTLQDRLNEEAAIEIAEEAQEQAAVVEAVAEAAAPKAEETPEFTEEDRGGIAALKAERKRARDLEKQVKELQSKVQIADQADLGEQEKAIAEATAKVRAEAKAEFDSQILKLRVESKSAGMNFHDPALTMSLLDVEADATDDEIVDALKDLAEDRPYLVKSVRPDVAPGPRPGKDGGMSTMTDESWFRDFMHKK